MVKQFMQVCELRKEYIAVLHSQILLASFHLYPFRHIHPVAVDNFVLEIAEQLKQEEGDP